MESDISFASATELRRQIAAKDVSIIELTELFYRRIEQLNPQLNAYLSLCPDQALAAAKQAQEAVQKGENLGLLHGIPISIKDLEATQGIPTTMGSTIFRDRLPEVDSVVVERVSSRGGRSMRTYTIGAKTYLPYPAGGTDRARVLAEKPCR